MVDDGFWREALVMTAVAERAASLIDVCGEDDLVGGAQSVLDSVWVGVSGARRADGPNPLRGLERLAGPEAPDSDTPASLAVAALEGPYAAAFMAYRLERYGDPIGVGDNVHGALDGLIHFTRDPGPIFIDPRNLPPPGPFVARERAACLRDRVTASGAAFRDAAASIRARSQDERSALRGEIRRALGEVRAFGRDW